MTCPQKRTAIHAAISILTPAKGGDSQLSASAASASDFNSHPREGGDNLWRGLFAEEARISILTPARGVTPDWLLSREKQLHISILTPARGVTIIFGLSLSCFSISIPTPARGVTALFSPGRICQFISIPTPARGVTSPPLWTSWMFFYFNSHPREGGDTFPGPLRKQRL